LGRISFLKVRFGKWFQDFNLEQLDVKVANRVLGLFVALLSLYFFANLVVSLINLTKTPRLESNTPVAKVETNFTDSSGFKKAVSYYLDKVRDRDIFTMGPKKVAEKPADNSPSAKSLEIASTLKLVGISWSNDPDAMIEDTKGLKTFFVKRGEMVGEAKVQAIFKDKVVLNLGGEEFELK
jgi:hypothetical protein